jgi:hypothetical protein
MLNNAVPILELLVLPQLESSDILEEFILVTPMLRPFDDPGFHCRAEFVNAALQFLRVQLRFVIRCAVADSICRA